MRWIRLHRAETDPSVIGGYGIAILAVAAAAAITRLLWREGDSAIFPLFFGAVVVASWYGGLGPGLFVTALSAVVTAFVLLPPARTFAAARDDVLRLLVFTLISLLTSSLHAAQRRARQQEHRARQAAEEAAAAKGRFLAMVSHELRNPLNPILTLASALEADSALPQPVRDDMSVIRRNVDLEVRLIDDLLDLSRFSSGRLRLRLEAVDLKQPLTAALEVCRDEIDRKHIDLRLELTDAPLHVTGDPLRLQQIFWNLLRNAIKFTPVRGTITFRSFAAPNQQAAVEICDNGIGIDPPRLSAIFQAFEQGGPDISARFGGLGLGLAICRALVEAHGGAITAASPGKGRGAIFTVRLPAAIAAPADPALQPAGIAST